MRGAGRDAAETRHDGAAQVSADHLGPARDFRVQADRFLAAITCTFGNLAAYGQTNIKRLLAYSTIAHAGYMMMPVAAAVALGRHESRPRPRTRWPHWRSMSACICS